MDSLLVVLVLSDMALVELSTRNFKVLLFLFWFSFPLGGPGQGASFPRDFEHSNSFFIRLLRGPGQVSNSFF